MSHRQPQNTATRFLWHISGSFNTFYMDSPQTLSPVAATRYYCRCWLLVARTGDFPPLSPLYLNKIVNVEDARTQFVVHLNKYGYRNYLQQRFNPVLQFIILHALVKKKQQLANASVNFGRKWLLSLQLLLDSRGLVCSCGEWLVCGKHLGDYGKEQQEQYMLQVQ